jgi:glycosyltransferase involved in cell wall biosynthesis
LTLHGPCDGVIWFGNVDWWYHNRGHSSTRMATRIAAYVPTIWINSIGMRMPVPGKTEIAWKRYTRKLKSIFKGLKQDPASGMYVYTPWFVPRYSPRAIEFNGMLLSMQVRSLIRRLNIQRPSAGVSMPTMTPAVERLPWVSVVFERCDDFTTLPEANAPIIADLERRLLQRSDHAVYVNDDLFEKERYSIADAQMISHGVDFDAFVQARPITGPKPPAPPEIRDLPRPIVGFYGGMDEYRMDVDLMVKIAKHIPTGTLLLVGPEQMDLSRIKAQPNVRHIGQVAPDRLPEIAGQFDVGVIPFLQNEFNRKCNPVKLKEYLAAGYPIVAMRLQSFDKYADLIYLADSHQEFLSGLDKAIADHDPLLVQRRRQAVSGDSWDKVAAKVARMLEIVHPRLG